jgi:hypothetical protein
LTSNSDSGLYRLSIAMNKSKAHSDDLVEGSAKPVFGLFSAVAHPAPPELLQVYSAFQRSYSNAWKKLDAPVAELQYMPYPPAALHCTVQTFHPFWAPTPLSPEIAESAWCKIVAQASCEPDWPYQGQIRVVNACLERTAGFLQVEDIHGCVQQMRDCLTRVIQSGNHDDILADAGGKLYVPRIFHMTCLRWRDPAFAASTSAACFDELAAAFRLAWPKNIAIDVDVSSMAMIRERLPYMADISIPTTFALRSPSEATVASTNQAIAP